MKSFRKLAFRQVKISMLLLIGRRRKHIWDQSIWSLFWNENTFLNQMHNESCKCVYLYVYYFIIVWKNQIRFVIPYLYIYWYPYIQMLTNTITYSLLLYKSNIMVNLRAVYSEIACNYDNLCFVCFWLIIQYNWSLLIFICLYYHLIKNLIWININQSKLAKTFTFIYL